MAYTTINKSGDFFNTITWSGTGSGKSETGVGFQPDWVWTKGRTLAGYNHYLVDAVRGSTKVVYANLTEAEGTDSNGISAFNSDGYTFGTSNGYNNGSNTYVAWNWKANGAGSSNTSGNVTTTVSVNTTAGFSIVSYSGTGSASSTMGHGLGSTPGMIMIKRLNANEDWRVWHQNLSATTGKNLKLNTSEAEDSNNSFFYSSAPNANTFNPGSGGNTNSASGTYIAYCFAEKTGYSKFGKYIGNGNADGSFIYTGFKPAFVMIKQSSASGESWFMYDNKRSVSNVVDDALNANSNSAEFTGSGNNNLDILSNGFKLRATDARQNASGATYIYMAFGQSLVGTNNIPCTAR
jgi:hypothetical protein